MSWRVKLLKIADRFGGGLFTHLLGWWSFHKTLGSPFIEVAPESLRRVMFIRPGGMGDLLLLLPAAARLKKALPQIKLTLVGEKRNRPVAALTDVFDEVLCYDDHPFAFLRRLRLGGWDAAIDTEQFHFLSASFASLSMSPVRVGFKTSPTRNELYTHLVDYPMDCHESEAFDKLVEPLCGPNAEPVSLTGLIDLTRLPADVPGLSANAGHILALFPYGGSREKAWPSGRWAEIVRRLIALDAGPVVLVGGGDSTRLAREIVRSVNDARLVSLVGRLTLPQTGAVLTRSRLYVGCDTGVTHLAMALGTQAIVLFGPSDERKWGAPRALGTSVFTRVPCRPCSIFGYVKRCRTVDCMDRISQEMVWTAIERELGR